MATVIQMPAVVADAEDAVLTAWLVAEGDKVTKGQALAEIETDKANVEVESEVAGVIGRLLAKPDDRVAVGAPICVVLAEGEDASAIDAALGEEASAAAVPPPADPEGGTANEAESPEATGELRASDGTADTKVPETATAPVRAHGERVFASPLARRLAAENDLDIAAIAGRGPRGRVVHADVEAAIAARDAAGAKPAAAAQAAPATAPVQDAPKRAEAVAAEAAPEAGGAYQDLPLSRMRRAIARRLTESKSSVPHFYVTVDCELEALLKLRGELNAAAPEKDGKPAYKLSVNDMVIKALALALKAVPDANVSWTETAMLKHKHADVGVAVSIPGGLITPIIRDACHKSLSQISNEMKDMAARAKARKLKPEEYQGGTTAVSNLGMFGVKDFAAIVNPPHATILAVGAGEQRAVVKGGQLAVATVMSVTLSTDHRAVDGALGAELLAAFKGYIEKPMAMLV
ncbi:MAG: pyruvate dehydrogenase complex dihydrolipoamide acetyltransferase [Bosea sp. 32-68-6]|nr:MAG: pyruvate dehydrogenase complex dihydrolipoamide acetyltransferase [Bosea sp. 32-68-6]